MSPALHSAHLALLNDQSRLPTVAHAFVVAAVIMTKWDRRYKTRKALAKLDDHTLQDVGITRTVAHQESRKPFWRA